MLLQKIGICLNIAGMKYSREDTFIKAFGNQLRKIRMAKKFSQEKLAFEADLMLSQIGRIERGTINTSISMVCKLAKALKVDAKELFDF